MSFRLVPSNTKSQSRGAIATPSRGKSLRILKAILFSGLAFIPGYQCAAQDVNTKVGESLSIAPKNAEFYFGSFHGDKQLKAIIDGPVVSALVGLPVVQENWKEFQRVWDEPQGNLAMARFAWDSPVLQDILKFSADLLSEDTFVYGSGGIGHWTNFITQTSERISNSISSGMEFDDDLQMEFLDSISAELHARDLPTIVFAGKFASEYDAVSKVDQLEMLIGLGKQSSPEAEPYLRKIKRVDDARGSRLVLELSGAMIPWELVDQNEEFSDEVKSRAREVLEKARFTLVAGMLDGYFVVASCPKVEALMRWKEGEHLISHDHLKPALAIEGYELANLVYVSDEFAKTNFDTNFKDILSKNVNLFVETLRNIEDLSENQELFLNDLQSDGERLNAKLMALMPPFLGSLQYSWLTENGSESRVHNRTPNPLLNGSSKLELLNKLGGAPMIAVATKYQRQLGYEEFVGDFARTARKLLLRAEELKLNGEGEENEDLAQAKRVLEICWPTLESLGSIFSSRLAPALTGESALSVTAGNVKAKQWFDEMPEASEELPIYEVGFVLGVNDSNQFRGAVNDIRSQLNELLNALREEFPGEIPEELKIPSPVEVASELGTKVVYPIPEELSVPEGLVPQALYAADSFVMTYSDEQTKSLATSTELQVGTGLIDSNANYANAAYVDIGALLATLQSWSNYAAEVAAENQGVDLDENLIDTRESIGADLTLTMNDLLSVWNVFSKVGKISNTITVEESCETVSRTVYTQSLP